MIVAIDQPRFLPWLGYLDRIQKADFFVLLDQLPFERQNYQNRVQFKTTQGAQWLSVPVFQPSASSDRCLLDILVDDQNRGSQRWGRKAVQALEESYGETRYFKLYAPALKEILEARWQRLVDLDRKLLEFLMGVFDIRKPVMRSSELRLVGQKTDVVLGACRTLGADALLCGMGGCRKSLDLNAFARAGIRVAAQRFQHPRYVQQPRPAAFIEGLSAVDMLFNCGPESADILKECARADAPAAAL
jgi:hypothetical protein